MTLIETAGEDDSNPREILFNKLRDYQIAVEGINDKTQLRSIPGLDSLDFLQINIDIEEQYNIELEINDYDERSTIGDWIGHIERRKRKDKQ